MTAARSTGGKAPDPFRNHPWFRLVRHNRTYEVSILCSHTETWHYEKLKAKQWNKAVKEAPAAAARLIRQSASRWAEASRVALTHEVDLRAQADAFDRSAP